MNISMTGIDPLTNRFEVTEKLTEVLHSDKYFKPRGKGHQVMNFRVELAEPPNIGMGTLTLPSKEDGIKFLSLVRKKKVSVKVNNRNIFFEESNEHPQWNVVQELNVVRFISPQTIQSREQKLEELREPVQVDRVEVGILSRHQTKPTIPSLFHPEWKTPDAEDASLRIDLGHKLIRIRIGDPYRDSTFRLISLRFSNIRSIWVGWDSGKPFVVFDMFYPPDFELERVNRERSEDSREDQRMGRRVRVGYLDSKHASVSPFAYHIRLLLPNQGHLDAFRKLCKTAAVTLFPAGIGAETRSLCSATNIYKLEKWFRSLHTQWGVAFQLAALLYNGLLNPAEVLSLEPAISDLLRKHPHDVIARLLKDCGDQLRLGGSAFGGSNVTFMNLCTKKLAEDPKPTQEQNSDPGVYSCHHVTFTPTRMILEGPFEVKSNRVIRAYSAHPNNFIRVDFLDEDQLQYRWDREVDAQTLLHERVGGKMREGFELGGRQFEFLAYSSSSLRSHAAWFMSKITLPDGEEIDADAIRNSLGDFSDLWLYPSRYAARLAQAFTATDPSVPIKREQFSEMQDIEIPNKRYNFTDGIGTISAQLADQIWERLCLSRGGTNPARFLRPCAFQIRFLGYKGVVSVDEQLTGVLMRLRPSMRKFEGRLEENNMIEIAQEFNYPMRLYLNRSLITILEHRGVNRDAFLKLQDDAIADIHQISDSVENLHMRMKEYGLGSSYQLPALLRRLEDKGLNFMRHRNTIAHLDCPFFNKIIFDIIIVAKRDLKYRARIPVPGSYKLVGIADEGVTYVPNMGVITLKEGEIFACVQDGINSQPFYLKGQCTISRSPTVHPGDIQNVWAIGKPPEGSPCFFRNLKNVIVFSCLGQRPLPSCLSGGDLDGDTYDICMAPQLLTTTDRSPGDYKIQPFYKIQEKDLLDANGDFDPMIPVRDFFVRYIHSDVLGMLSTNHLIIADQSMKSVLDPRCLKLAELCSDAVDYPKNGNPVDATKAPRRLIPYIPNWKASPSDPPEREDTYKSDRALGHLFSEPKLNLDANGPKETYGLPTDAITKTLEPLVSGQLPEKPSPCMVAHIFEQYVDRLRYICLAHSLTPDGRLSESEVVLGTILEECQQNRRRKDRIYRMNLPTQELVKNTKTALAPNARHGTPTLARLRVEHSWEAWGFVKRELARRKGESAFGLCSFGLISLSLIFETLDQLEELQT